MKGRREPPGTLLHKGIRRAHNATPPGFCHARDAPGIWLAHGLDLDVMAMGQSLEEALRLGAQVVSETVIDLLASGKQVNDQPRAPQTYWDELHRITRQPDTPRGVAKRPLGFLPHLWARSDSHAASA